MEPKDFIHACLRASGNTMWGVSKKMGGPATRLDNMIRRGSIPRLDTAARIADACGCDLVLVDRETGERVAVIEP